MPWGAFSLGSALIVIIFSGIYGSIFYFESSHFVVEEAPAKADWLFFSVYSAVGRPYAPVAAASQVAHGLVAIQILLGVGWAFTVFSAVMTYVQEQLRQKN